MCGVAFLARRGDLVGFARRGCKDRICPTCGHRRRQRFAHALRRIAALRQYIEPTGEPCEGEAPGPDGATPSGPGGRSALTAAASARRLDGSLPFIAGAPGAYQTSSWAPRDFQRPELALGGDRLGDEADQLLPLVHDQGDDVDLCRARLVGAFAQRRRLLFVTLTRPKTALECVDPDTGRRYLKALPAAMAVDDLLGYACSQKTAKASLTAAERRDKGGCWRRFLWAARRWLFGGVRSLEITARRKGDMVGTHEVKIPGAHAHLHCILEVSGRTTAADVREAWREACPGVVDRAIDVQELDDDNVYQVASYCFNTRKLLDSRKVDASYVRDVFAALHGRRLVAAFGTWRCFDLGLREPKGDLVFGDRTLYTAFANRPEEQPSRVRWTDGSDDPLEDVLQRFHAGPVTPIGGLEPDPAAVEGVPFAERRQVGPHVSRRAAPATRARDGPTRRAAVAPTR